MTKMPAERKELPDKLKLDDDTGVWVPTKQYQNHYLCHVTDKEVKVFDCSNRAYICTLSHAKVRAVGSLQDSGLVTVSQNGIKILI